MTQLFSPPTVHCSSIRDSGVTSSVPVISQKCQWPLGWPHLLGYGWDVHHASPTDPSHHGEPHPAPAQGVLEEDQCHTRGEDWSTNPLREGGCSLAVPAYCMSPALFAESRFVCFSQPCNCNANTTNPPEPPPRGCA